MTTFIIIALVIVALIVFLMRSPKDFRVEKSITINAPASVIFPHANDLKKFSVWNPWNKKDPNIKETFSGPNNGVGSHSDWIGNAQVGQGNMTITKSEPNSLVLMDLTFIKPFPGTNLTEFILRPDGDKTVFTWAMSGKLCNIPKFMSLFISMDKMMGSEFEKGLQTLKSIVEGQNRQA
ncbi:MAG: SRPBCC family protein [Bdellovibrionota bacterium]